MYVLTILCGRRRKRKEDREEQGQEGRTKRKRQEPCSNLCSSSSSILLGAGRNRLSPASTPHARTTPTTTIFCCAPATLSLPRLKIPHRLGTHGRQAHYSFVFRGLTCTCYQIRFGFIVIHRQTDMPATIMKNGIFRLHTCSSDERRRTVVLNIIFASGGRRAGKTTDLSVNSGGTCTPTPPVSIVSRSFHFQQSI